MLRCPECAREMQTGRADEEFDFDTGRGIVRVVAKGIPFDICLCGLKTHSSWSGFKRDSHTLSAVLRLLHEKVPEPKGE